MQWYEGYLPSPQEAHSLAGNLDEEQALRMVGARLGLIWLPRKHTALDPVLGEAKVAFLGKAY